MTAPSLSLADCVARIGAELRSEEFRTSSHRLAQFAAACDDCNPTHLSGQIALPTFAHIPVMQSMVQVLQQATTAFVMHGEQDFLFHQPIVPGQRLFSRSRLVGVRSTKAGMLLVLRAETATHEGAAVCTQYITCLQPGSAEPASHGEGPPEAPKAEASETSHKSFAIGPDKTRAYAEAARDYSAYCLNAEAARAVGFEAPLVHGMLSLSLAAVALVERAAAGDSTRLRRLGCRFSHPLFSRDGETLEVAHSKDSHGRVAFAATDRNGNPVLSRGFAEVSP
ncbi:MAG: MaoC/PaaZ C-terminal domain-containing protein [Kiloniellales bacterium]